MKTTAMKWILGFGIAITTLAVGATAWTLNAEATAPTLGSTESIELSETTPTTLADMLTLAIQDEYLAQAEYNLILAEYGNIRPFSKIVLAEQTHIDLLIPLFEAYGIEIPVNTAADSTVLPESVSAAIAMGVDAEQANIAMYDLFLADETLPEDVKAVFELLRAASVKHLSAFQKDRVLGIGADVANLFKGQGQGQGQGNRGEGKSGFGGQGNRGNGSQNVDRQSQADCTNK
jgi:hypothetical protein